MKPFTRMLCTSDAMVIMFKNWGVVLLSLNSLLTATKTAKLLEVIQLTTAKQVMSDKNWGN